MLLTARTPLHGSWASLGFSKAEPSARFRTPGFGGCIAVVKSNGRLAQVAPAVVVVLAVVVVVVAAAAEAAAAAAVSHYSIVCSEVVWSSWRNRRMLETEGTVEGGGFRAATAAVRGPCLVQLLRPQAPKLNRSWYQAWLSEA